MAEQWELPKDEGLDKLWMIDSKQLQVALDDAGQPVMLGKGAYGAVCPFCTAIRTRYIHRIQAWGRLPDHVLVAPETFHIQCAEDTSYQVDVSSASQRALGYMQLWVFCLRHFPEMTPITPKITPRGRRVARTQIASAA